MPSAPLRFCAVPGCPNKVQKGRCPEHTRERRRERYHDAFESLYSTAQWRRLRAQVIAEQPFCADRGADGCTLVAEAVHHRRKRVDTPEAFFERSNLEALCARCHNRRTRAGE